jgi:tetratricopeptide (TPR) repeat protein
MQGRYDKGLIESREEFRLNPNGDGYYDLLYFYLRLNRLKEAQSTVEEAEAKKFDSPSIRYCVYQLRFLQNDAAGMFQQVAWATGKLGVEDGLLGLEADTAAYSGRLGQARDLSRQAVVSAKRAEAPEVAAEREADAALREALFGNPAETRERAADALGLSNSWVVQSRAALALAFAGDALQARTLADDLANRFPDHTIVQSYDVPTIRAELALSHDDPSGAIEILQAAVPYELSDSGALYPVYVRGQAYLAAHKGKEAAAEFQKIHDHPGIVVNAPIGTLAHLGLGRACALSGDKTKAKAAYQDFLAIWKNADPDISNTEASQGGVCEASMIKVPPLVAGWGWRFETDGC